MRALWMPTRCIGAFLYLVSEKVEELARAAYQAYSEEEQLDERPALERELKAVEGKLQNAVQAVLRGVDLDTLTDTVNDLKAQREALRASLTQAPAQMPKLTEAHFRAALTMIADKPGKELLDSIVNRVILKDDTVIICINLTDGNNDPPLEQILFRITEPPCGARRPIFIMNRETHLNTLRTIKKCDKQAILL